jgi:excisionase family DNA binding protein
LENETNQPKPEREIITRKTLSRQEAADYLGIHINTIDRSNVPRIRIGGRVLFNRETLDRLLSGKEAVEGRRARRNT